MSRAAPRIAIVFDSRYGSTLALAQAMQAGCGDENADGVLYMAAGFEPEVGVDSERDQYVQAQRTIDGIPVASLEDIRAADALVMGSPTRFGHMTRPMMAFLERIGPLWREGALIGKVGAAFTSTGGMHSGHETTLLSLIMTMFQHGMVVAGVPHSVEALIETRFGGSPLGAGAVTTFNGRREVDANELAIARALGARVARLARQVEPEPAPLIGPS
ncbi:Putative Trp repressor binding protein [Salinisphaera shabanensis E1L3A]|uniref:Trp repressor binding protein n=1 Tax=Salinisphaera shabanensis E1L3A TaxID=1033802 RepID=U2E789_9GAMM|nr:NAD(P)H:quinone oxidoreductase [Salinisphaera shabanensis]ERJ19601.1 Putative Trp repressor binding protein [Salinisphaera shabanensis E1L3A]